MNDDRHSPPDVVTQLRQDIACGAHPLGSRLVEDRLCARYDVKRHTLRAAFAHLVDKGLLTQIPNRGVQVREPTPDEVDEIYNIRMLLETRAAELTPLPAPPNTLTAMKRHFEAHVAAVRDFDIRRIYLENVAFHDYEFALCSNQRLVGLIRDLTEQAQMVRTIAYGVPRHLDTIIDQHREIIAALATTDRARYVAAVRVHIPASTVEYRRIFEQIHGTGTANR